MSGATEITSQEQLSSLIRGSKLTIVNFYRTPDTSLPDLASIASTAQLSRAITYATCDVSAHAWAATAYPLSADPTFIAFRSGSQLKVMPGLQSLLTELPGVLTAASQRGGGAGESAGSTEWLPKPLPKNTYNITDAIETPRLEMLNSTGNVKVLFGPAKPEGKEGDYVVSDTDEQLMIFIPFQSAVKLHSLQITSLASADMEVEDEEVPSRPKTVKLYVNTSQVLGFDEADGREATQTVELEWDEAGNAVILTRFVKFQQCAGVTLFFETVEREGAEKCRVDRVRVVGEKMGEKVDMTKMKQQEEE